MGFKSRTIFKSSFGAGILITLVYNLGYGFTHSGIDNFAHVGGLAGGYLAALTVGLAGERLILPRRGLALLLTLFLTAGGIYAGFMQPANVEMKKEYDIRVKAQDILSQAADSFNKQDYRKAGELSREVLELGKEDEDIQLNALDLLAASLANQGKPQEAIEYAERLVEINPARGHYLLGFCYLKTGREDLAREELRKAVELDPQNTHAKELLDALEK